MKKICAIAMMFAFCVTLNAQNVGIGIDNPSKAKLEVSGVAGNGNTVALFGSEGTGISFQRNWPTIGFNQYRDEPVGSGKYIGNGFASLQFLDPGTGNWGFDIYPNGSANTSMPLPRRVFTLAEKGNVTVGTSFSNSTFTTSRIPQTDAAMQINGTQYSSIFHAGAEEWTFLRAGTNGASVVINDIPNGKINLGLFGGSTKVGVNISNPVTSLQTMGGTSFFRRTANISRPNPVINVGDNTYIVVFYVFSSGAQLEAQLTNGLVPGQILIIESDPANTEYGFDLRSGGNLFLEGGGVRLRPMQTITLIWNGNRWLETSRAQNSN